MEFLRALWAERAKAGNIMDFSDRIAAVGYTIIGYLLQEIGRGKVTYSGFFDVKVREKSHRL